MEISGGSLRMETRGGNVARSRLHSDDNVDSPNLRDFLRIKDDDNNCDGRTNFAGQTLGSALDDEKRGETLRVQSNRTLLDIIRDDPSGGKGGKKSWQHFKERLRLRRQGSGASWTSTVPIPASDVPIHQNNNSRRMMTRRDSTRMNTSNSDGSAHRDDEFSSGGPRNRPGMLQRNASRAVERSSRRFGNFDDLDDSNEETVEQMEEEEQGEMGEDDAEAEGEGGGGGEEQAPVRMSLMALLAETDKQMGLDGSAYMMDDDEEEEEEEEKGGGEYNNCCVCMVRHKGAAFIPCGHTFCRLCSRELWVQRGNCPLCNNFILEILDIF